MNPYMLGFLAFVGVTSVVAIVGFVLSKFYGGDGAASERLEAIVGRSNRKADSSTDLMIKQALQEVGKANLLEKLTPEFFKVSKMFEQADLKMQPSVLFGIAMAFGFVGAMISTVMVNIYASPIGGLIMFGLPFMWLWFKRASRLKKFAAQLPEAMELVARALRAGHSLASGFHVVAHEMPEPISKEFARVYEEQNLGMTMEDSLQNLCDRVPNLDLRFFVTSVNIQRQTGGDLAEILDRIGHIIRERFKILGQVKALTAEGRLSGIVLIAMPIGLFLMMLHMKPDYIELLWTDKLGQQMSGGAIILMLIGSYAIKKIVDIKV
ncbi:type II secretion system F family protein [Zavarzinella formosa]|uniref:type II secretion system F family protein n=1 Tax=Zavarzinella formosa TaxID=360055 RepID=UPI0002D528FF|nr:type II secretion system F family protein [Zavarzinella formosa]